MAYQGSFFRGASSGLKLKFQLICSNINEMNVEYDENKRMATLEARGLDMARSSTILDGPTLTVRDSRKEYGEERNISIGFLDGTMVVLVWTLRGDVHRIISLRKANERERRFYAGRFGVGS